MPAVVHGMAELSRAFADAGGAAAAQELRDALGRAAEPVRRDAEQLALSEIRRMPLSPQWAGMRVGVLSRVVYVAPVKRGVGRGANPRRRRNLAELLMGRAMEPALQRNEERVARAVEQALDRVIADFNRGGP